MSVVLRKRGAVDSFPRKAEFIQHVRVCLAKARLKFDKFNIPDAQIPVTFVAKGRAAGMAKWAKRFGESVYNLEFNVDAINKDWDEMVNEVIPHEVAHVVDYVYRGKSNHDRFWSMLCSQLGGNPSRTHTIPVEKARKTTKVQYIASCGTEVWLTTQMHNKVQKGGVRRLTRTGGLIDASRCKWIQKAV